MKNKPQHISIKLASVLLAFILIIPSVVKFSHALAKHEHTVCIEKNQIHFHKVDVDCEFYKFKLQTQSIAIPINYELTEIEDNHNNLIEYYAFLSDYQNLHFSLRGPPVYS